MHQRLLFAILGSVLFALVSYWLVELFALWYGPRYIKSESDIGDAFMWGVAFMLICLITGGIVGYRWASRSARP